MKAVKNLTKQINGLKIELKLHSIQDQRGVYFNVYSVYSNNKLIKEFTQRMGLREQNVNGAFIEKHNNGENAKKTIIVIITSENNVFADAYESESRIKKEINFLIKNQNTFFTF